MTAEQFLKRNSFHTHDRYKLVNLVFKMERKLKEHLLTGNDEQIRKYMIVTHVFWPISSDIPISIKLFNRSLSFLESRGWHIHFDEDHSDRISNYITRTSEESTGQSAHLSN